MNTLVASGQAEADEPRLRSYLLGRPLVSWNDTALAISRRSVRALLYRLACEPEPVGRGHLRLLFWPDLPESMARRNLSHLLTHLRQALPMPQMLVVARDEVWLEPSQTWCDVLLLKSAGSEPAKESSDLRHLASLFRGPFLDGFDLPGCPEFEYWCLVEGNALEHQYLQILEQLVEHCTAAGAVGQAVQYAHRYLQTDPLAEAMHRRLIQLFAASGERHLALQQFERCASILETSLGVGPLPETRAVYEAVLCGQRRFPQPPPPSRLPRLLGRHIPILDREDELRRLEEPFLRLHARQGGVVLISGEPGIGKSRLLEEFANRHQEQAILLVGRGHAGEQAIPYQPILGVLRVILDLGGEEGEWQGRIVSADRPPLDFVEPIWLSEVSRLLPEIHLAYPYVASPLPLEPESAHTRLFDALCHVILSYAAARGPILLILDDVQWMDATTTAWLVHIGRFLARRRYPILILGAYRSEEAKGILELRHALARAGVLTELSLSGLSQTAVLAMLRHMIGPRSGDVPLANRLHEATGGNPFYLIETIYRLTEDRRLAAHLQEPMQFPLPQTVREAIQARLQHLSPITHQVLEAGAVLGQSFGIDLLRLTAGRSQAEVLWALEELVARSLLVETEADVCFKHEILRQHVEESLSEARGKLLHRRAGRAYERLKPEAFAALAYHFERGGDPERALQHHRRAANRAQTLFAWRMAEFHQGRMLDLLTQLDAGLHQPELVCQRGELLAERADARHLQDRLAERDADLQALSSLGAASGHDYIRFLSLVSRLRYLNLDGDYAQAIAVAEEGLRLLESSDALSQDTDQARVAQCRLLAQLGLAYDLLGKPLEALDVLERAWNLSAEETNPEACGRILHILGYVHSHLRDYARALECQQQAHAYHTEAGDHHRIAWDLIDIGALHRHLGDPAQAERFLGEGLELARRVGSQQVQAYGLAQRGSLDLYRGDYAAAETHYREAMAMQPATHSEHSLATPEAGVGLALYHLGDHAQSRHWLERALSRARASGHRRCAAEVLIELGMLDTAEGNLPLARQHLEQGLALARDCQLGECLAAGLATMARLERLAGDAGRALEVAGETEAAARQIHLTSCQMWGEVEAGFAHLALGDLASSLEHTGRAASMAPQAGQDWIGCEEAYRTHALVLRALSQDEAADHYERCAWEAVQAKAGRIPDPAQRDHYLAKSHQSPTSSL